MSKGKIFVVGMGPGDMEHMTYKAVESIKECDTIIGYSLYVELLGKLIENKEILSSGMRREVERCTRAVEEAEKGKKVAMVSSGDAGIYGMAGITLQIVQERNSDIEVEVIPGITAATAAASSLGAPLMHDFAIISLSDLLTPWEMIETRLHMAGKGDFVVVLYNPKSHGRTEQIEKAQKILSQYRAGTTPVGIVRNAKRGEETKVLSTLSEMLDCEMDMTTVIVIGNSNTYVWKDKMITPRGYEV